MDAVPDAAPLRGLFAMCCFFLRKALYAETGAISAGRCSAGHGGAAHKLKLGAGAVRRMVYCLMRAIPAEWIFRRLDDLAHMAAGRPTRYVRILTFPTPSGRPFGYRREWYEDTADIEFEGMLFPGPRDWDGYLSYKFGDYMTLPPPGQRHWHPVSKFRLPAGV
jgi:lipopolysaccharide cholinephosphotransferase